jgi:putative ATPase
MRPQNLEEMVGQSALLSRDSAFRLLIASGHLPSMILWGPPGSGKTSLAQLLAHTIQGVFIQLSAVEAGVPDIRRVLHDAESLLRLHDKRTCLFIDEIHRFNKAQQDALLPGVEKGLIILIGATTENPSFSVNGALLSRSKVFVLERLSEEDVVQLIERALQDTRRGLGNVSITVPSDVRETIARVANGDARVALNLLEQLVHTQGTGGESQKKTEKPIVLQMEQLRTLLQRTHLLYDKQGEEHYNLISALHKSIRGSDANAALYWLGRILESGEDPLYVARRLIRAASEDIGLADPSALLQAMAGYEAARVIGMPECTVNLAQVVAYLARAPKSNALYTAYGVVKKDVYEFSNEPVPIHLRNAPTKLMKELGYGKEYKYNPDYSEPVDQAYLPERLSTRIYLDFPTPPTS